MKPVKSLLISVALFLSTIFVAIAQTPNVREGVNPCGSDEKWNAAADTCEHSTSKFLWHDGGWVLVALIPIVLIGAFMGPKVIRWLGFKSDPRPPGGGIHTQ